MRQSFALLRSTQAQSKKKGLELKRGDCVLTEAPFVYALKSKYRKERCDHCLESGKVLKCSNCNYVYYCNRACQTSAWPTHKNECGSLKEIAPRVVPDAARVLARIILKLQNGGDMEKGFYTETCSRKFRDLMSHYQELKNDPKRLEHLQTLRVVLEDLLGEILIPNQMELLAIYGRLVTNGFNILDAEMNSIATGIYLGVSVTDHSCTPNAVATFDGTTLKIHLTEDIECLDWSKIFISYIDLLNTSEDRRKDLQDNYYFLCMCSRCTDPSETVKMNAGVCRNKNCSALVDVSKETCAKCGFKNTEKLREQHKEVTEMTKEHLNNMKDIAFLDVCQICLQKQDRVLHLLNIWHVKTLDSAFESAININKWDEALEFGTRLVPGFRKYYGEWNPLLGLLYMKIGKIQLFKGLLSEALANFQHSKKILEVTHGRNHNLLREQLAPMVLQAKLESEGCS